MPVEQSNPWSPLKRSKTRRLASARRLRQQDWCDRANRRPVLRFTPYAWAKLEYLRDCGPTEIGGFGVSAQNDLLLVEDVHLVQQSCDVLSVAFDDVAVADYFDRQVDQGLALQQFARIWIHTHPGYSASPSPIDEETFARVFGTSDWAVMFIIARGGRCEAWLRFSVGPTALQRIGVSIDFSRSFGGSNQAAWDAEYSSMVRRRSAEHFEDAFAIDGAYEAAFWNS